jgi:glutathione synthase/RimK-type ligase-like ATP-grasp enzyme
MKNAAPVLLLGAPQDPHIQAVQRELSKQSVPVWMLSSDVLDQGVPFHLSLDGARVSAALDGRDLLRVRSVYLRQLPAPWPPVGTQDGNAVVLRDWMTPYMLSRERDAAWRAVLMHWKAAGVPMLNPPHGDRVAQNKARQLMTAAQKGVPVPPTLICNDAAALDAFVAEHGDVAIKPLEGGAYTQRFHGKVPARLKRALPASPVIVQRFVQGRDVRLYMLGREVLSCAAIILSKQHNDFRMSEEYQEGRATYAPVTLPKRVAQAAVRWMKACGLVFAGLDIKQDAAGGFTFLEMNSSPIFMDQELKTGHRISAALAGWLAGASA